MSIVKTFDFPIISRSDYDNGNWDKDFLWSELRKRIAIPSLLTSSIPSICTILSIQPLVGKISRVGCSLFNLAYTFAEIFADLNNYSHEKFLSIVSKVYRVFRLSLMVSSITMGFSTGRFAIGALDSVESIIELTRRRTVKKALELVSSLLYALSQYPFERKKSYQFILVSMAFEAIFSLHKMGEALIKARNDKNNYLPAILQGIAALCHLHRTQSTYKEAMKNLEILGKQKLCIWVESQNPETLKQIRPLIEKMRQENGKDQVEIYVPNTPEGKQAGEILAASVTLTPDLRPFKPICTDDPEAIKVARRQYKRLNSLNKLRKKEFYQGLLYGNATESPLAVFQRVTNTFIQNCKEKTLAVFIIDPLTSFWTDHGLTIDPKNNNISSTEQTVLRLIGYADKKFSGLENYDIKN